MRTWILMLVFVVMGVVPAMGGAVIMQGVTCDQVEPRGVNYVIYDKDRNPPDYPYRVKVVGGLLAGQPYLGAGGGESATYGAEVHKVDGYTAISIYGNVMSGDIASMDLSSKVLRLTAEFKVNANAGTDNYTRGLVLGFFTDTAGQNKVGFTGLNLRGNGDLWLWQAGAHVGSAVAYGGSWNNTEYFTLTYDVDTALGKITSISLEGSSADYTSLMTASNAFTDTGHTMDRFGVGGCGGAGAGPSFVLNSTLELSDESAVAQAVPEPASLGLLLLGLPLLLRRRA